MTNNEIKQRIVAVHNALNNISISGVQNINTLTGCFSILQELIQAIPDDVTEEG
jgi:hypothetical protein